MRQSCDVAGIGAMGASARRHLARRGVRTPDVKDERLRSNPVER